MAFNYIAYRRKKRSGRYKLRKRAEKILKTIKEFKNQDRLSILDIGTADGYMLEHFKCVLKPGLCLGIEPSLDFIKSKISNSCPIIQAVGERLPFRERSFDVITAASVLDHLQDPALFLKESMRVLRKNGIIVISLVSPFYDKLAVNFKMKEDDHSLHFTEKQLEELLKKEGFNVLKISRFALPFFGIFFEGFIERLLNAIGLRRMMFYILAVGQARE